MVKQAGRWERIGKQLALLADYRRMLRFVKPYRWLVALTMVLTLLAGTTEALVAWSIRPFLDVVILSRPEADLLEFFPLLIILFTVGQGLLKQGALYFSLLVNGRIVADIKAHMFRNLLQHEPAFFEATTSGSVLAQYNQDVEAACNSVFVNGKTLILRLTTSLSLIFVLFYNSWILASVALAALIAAVYPLTRLRESISRVEQQGHLVQTDLLTSFNEGYHGHRVIAAYGLSGLLCAKLKSIMAGYHALALNLARRTSGLSLFMHLMIALGLAGTVWLQGRLIAAGQLTPGGFVSFLTALLLLYNPLKSLSGTFNAMVGNRLALERLMNNLSREPAIRNSPAARKMASFSSEIRYENVSFEYQAGVPILRDVSLAIRKGEKVAVVGASGGGKTTLISLLPRFYDPRSGRVTIDGVDIRDIELASLREALALVFQDNFLFDGTIRENILLGRPEAGALEIEAAVDAACLRGLISLLPLGLETRIGERGVRLSGGEKQRVALARAFIRNAPIVILDEATSALDNESEALVQEAIENIDRDKTILIIAHRLSTIVQADRIMVLHDGEIVESGTHSELMAKPGGRYAGLYRAGSKNESIH